MGSVSAATILLHAIQPRHASATSLVDCLRSLGIPAWNRLRTEVRRRPELLTPVIAADLLTVADGCPGCLAAAFLDAAALDQAGREAHRAHFLQLFAWHPQACLEVAGNLLHEHCRMLDPAWVEFVCTHVGLHPPGAWGVLRSVAMHRHDLCHSGLVAWCREQQEADPGAATTLALALALREPARLPEQLAQVLELAQRHAAAVLTGAAAIAPSHPLLLDDALLDLARRHLGSAPEPGWQLLQAAATARPEYWTEAFLDALAETPAEGTRPLLQLLRTLIAAPSLEQRRPRLLRRYVARLRQDPTPGIDAAQYDFQGEGLLLITPALAGAVAECIAANAYPAYTILRRLIPVQPTLFTSTLVAATRAGIPHATNFGFGFYEALVTALPEHAAIATLSLFECLVREPINRAHIRGEEIVALRGLNERAEVSTALEALLRAPPPEARDGPARPLMALMFRPRLRAQRRVLFEALAYAATCTVRVTPPDAPETRVQKTPYWDLLIEILESGGEPGMVAAAGAAFLEGIYQLHHLFTSGVEAERFTHALAVRAPSSPDLVPPLPAAITDQDLRTRLRAIAGLAEALGTEVRLAPWEAWRWREEREQTELAHLAQLLPSAEGERRRRLERRRDALQERHRLRTEARATPAGEAFASEETAHLAKALIPAARAAFRTLLLQAVSQQHRACYQERLSAIVGRPVTVATVDHRLLPALLFMATLTHHPQNATGLRRLIVDRVSGVPHTWLREEPAALRWAAAVRAGCPQVHLDRWRAPFERRYRYTAAENAGEREDDLRRARAQTRALLERAGGAALADDDIATLRAAHADLQARAREPAPAPPPATEGKPAEPPAPPAPPAPPIDAEALTEAGTNLERIHLMLASPVSDFQGELVLRVESDPFEILCMGEYGFASCLALRGINAWSAVSNAIDIDKTVIWALDPGGNVVGRRLIALLPEGLLSYSTYANRHGLALNRLFADCIEAYAQHCGVPVIHQGHPQPLLSDAWYDDGAI